jgi:hypothetical protein
MYSILRLVLVVSNSCTARGEECILHSLNIQRAAVDSCRRSRRRKRRFTIQHLRPFASTQVDDGFDHGQAISCSRPFNTSIMRIRYVGGSRAEKVVALGGIGEGREALRYLCCLKSSEHQSGSSIRHRICRSAYKIVKTMKILSSP